MLISVLPNFATTIFESLSEQVANELKTCMIIMNKMERKTELLKVDLSLKQIGIIIYRGGLISY